MFTVDAHINSLGGKMDEITVFEERQNGKQCRHRLRARLYLRRAHDFNIIPLHA